MLTILLAAVATQQESSNDELTKQDRDFRWPNRQLSILVDFRSINASEEKILDDFFDQIQHKTCLRVNRLPARSINPFDPKQLPAGNENFVYIFKTQFGSYNRHPSLGLSSLGCVGQGRQSMVLTKLAFRWPELILRYHILRTLGVDSIERPEEEIRQLLSQLPVSQKIANDRFEAGANLHTFDSSPAFMTLTSKSSSEIGQIKNIKYLSDEDLEKVKQVYNCSEYRNRLSPKPLMTDPVEASKLYNSPSLEQESSQSSEDADKSAIDEAAKTIANQLLNDNSEREECKPMQSCTMQREDASTHHERPMLMKLDPMQAKDPQLQQANQMKLSPLNNASLATYRLMNAPELSLPQQQVSNAKSEMLISFEHANQQASNPVQALASSQVLKLCSCTCQTMTPQIFPPTLPAPVDSQQPPTEATITTSTQSETVTFAPPTSSSPTESEPATSVATEPTTTTTLSPPTTNTFAPSTSEEAESATASSELPEASSEASTSEPSTSATGQPLLVAQNGCDEVEWVRPNKSVYASARIVWDVDSANQNYFLCNNLINGELLPGKTHGFSCKVGSEGRAFEMHNFNVLTKPERVSLAWVERNSDTFGRTNFPVVGGLSKNQDPYVVSRCLVRDENLDVITLIGFVNSSGKGWFPFDDIQIECDHYDVLACVG